MGRGGLVVVTLGRRGVAGAFACLVGWVGGPAGVWLVREWWLLLANPMGGDGVLPRTSPDLAEACLFSLPSTPGLQQQP